jgi:hypothetical protein
MASQYNVDAQNQPHHIEKLSCHVDVPFLLKIVPATVPVEGSEITSAMFIALRPDPFDFLLFTDDRLKL